MRCSPFHYYYHQYYNIEQQRQDLALLLFEGGGGVTGAKYACTRTLERRLYKKLRKWIFSKSTYFILLIL